MPVGHKHDDGDCNQYIFLHRYPDMCKCVNRSRDNARQWLCTLLFEQVVVDSLRFSCHRGVHSKNYAHSSPLFCSCVVLLWYHDDVIKRKHFPCWRQWRGPLMFSLVCTWTKVWSNNREAGDLRRHRADYDVIVMADRFYPYTSGHCGNKAMPQRKWYSRDVYGLMHHWENN